MTRIEPKEVGEWADLPYFKLLLHKAELSYLNSEHEEVHGLLSWLLAILPVRDTGDEVSWIRRRVALLLVQLYSGNDYYGLPPHFVPLLSRLTYERRVDEFLQLGGEIEAAYKSYFDESQDLTQRQLALTDALQLHEQMTLQLEASLNPLELTIDDLEKSTQELLVEQVHLELALRVAAEDFKSAVVSQVECGCEDVLRAAGAIVTLVMNVYAGVVAVVQQGQAFRKKYEENEDDWVEVAKSFGKLLKVAGNSIEKIRKSYEEVRDILQEEERRDEAKILMAQEDFEEMIEPFLNLPEAREYRRLMRNFLDVVNTRNEQILELTAARLQFEAITAEIEARRQERLRLEGDLARTQNPLLPQYLEFMERAVTGIRIEILRGLYMEHKALNYWALEEASFVVSDDSLAHLKATHARYKARVGRAIEERNRLPQRFQTGRPVVLSREESPDTFHYFQEHGRLSFKLEPDSRSFRGRAIVLVDEMSVSVDGVSTEDGSLFVRIIHHGNAEVLDRQGKTHHYRHRPRVTFYEYDMETGEVFAPGNLGGGISSEAPDAAFAYLSPFATWSLEIHPRENPGLDLSQVREVRIDFNGTAVGLF